MKHPGAIAGACIVKTVFVEHRGNHQMTMFAKAQHWMNISPFSNCRNVNKIFVVTDKL
jgi:hypothetical protein